MEYITVRKTEEMVRIEIMVEYVGPYKYIYQNTTTGAVEYSSEQEPPIPFPHKYDIGIGLDVVKPENCNNTFDLELRNLTGSDQFFIIKIEWFQGEDKTPIYVWPLPPLQKRPVGKEELNKPIGMSCMYI